MSGLVDQLPVLIVAVPLSGAGLVAAVGAWLPRVLSDAIGMIVAVLVLAASCWLVAGVGDGRVVQWVGGWKPVAGHSVGIALVADRMAAGMVVIAAALAVAAFAYSWRYFDDVHWTFQSLMLVFLAAMSGFALAGDLFNAFVWFELMGVAAYALTGLRVEEPTSVHGAFNFGIVNTVGGSLSLVGVSLLYAETGELNLAAVGEHLRHHPAGTIVVVACGLLLSGVLVKAAIAPFHFWTADAEAVAPTPVCVLPSGAMVSLGVFAVARWWWVVFAGVIDADAVRHMLLALGVLTAIVGAVMCMAQRHIKRLLAYSTISHIGVVLTGVGLLGAPALAAAALYLVGHACVKSALFLGTGILLNRFESVDEHQLFGKGKGMHLTAVIFVVGAFGLAGLPPLGTWVGKALLEDAAGAAGAVWLVPIVIGASVMTGGAVLRVALRVFFAKGRRPHDAGGSHHRESPETTGPLRRKALPMLVPALALLGSAVAIGLIPALRAGVSVAGSSFVDTGGYVADVLKDAHANGTTLGPVPPVLTIPAIGLGLLCAALAVAVAAAGLFRAPDRTLTRVVVRRARSGVALLHRLHAPHIGDQVAWLLVGTAAIILALW